jgi:hypothetical protein
MAGRRYTVAYSGSYTVAGGDTDLLELVPATQKPCLIKGMVISQTSEVGDAQEEGVRISVILLPATFTGGSGGSTITASTPDSANAAAAFTAKCNNTTVATTSGTAVTRLEMGWNERNSPFDFWWPDGFEPEVKNPEGLVVRAQTTVGSNVAINCTFFIEED